ncbi:MAG: hypothetical protein Q9218_007158 [Villophora microphyllina]
MEVESGEHSSTIINSVSALSFASSDRKAWAQLQRELEAAGVSRRQLQQHRGMIVCMFQNAISKEDEVFDQGTANISIEDDTIQSRDGSNHHLVERPSSHISKKYSRPTLFMSFFTRRYREMLVSASRDGHVAKLKIALANGAYVNARDDNGWTALALATKGGHGQSVELLLCHGAHLNESRIMYTHESTPSVLAIRSGHVEILCTLLRHGADVNRGAPLHEAVIQDHLGMVRLLLDYHASTKMYSHMDLAPIIANAGRFDCGFGSGSSTPLHVAVMIGNINIVRVLLEAGANTESKIGFWTGFSSHTALHLAVLFNRTDVVRILLNHQAALHPVTFWGHTPLYLAVKNG